jgi:hypothetical protein
MPRRPIVLIVDEDLGLLYWLAKSLLRAATTPCQPPIAGKLFFLLSS